MTTEIISFRIFCCIVKYDRPVQVLKELLAVKELFGGPDNIWFFLSIVASTRP